MKEKKGERMADHDIYPDFDLLEFGNSYNSFMFEGLFLFYSRCSLEVDRYAYCILYYYK